MKNTLATWLKL